MKIDLSPYIAPRFFSPLPYLSGFTVSGDEAASFLHSQLTNDVNKLALLQAQRTGLCTAKGRLLAVMLQWKTVSQVFHLLPAEVKPQLMKRLKMFVLRAKASFSPQEQPVGVLGIWGAAAKGFAKHQVSPLNDELFIVRMEDCPVLGSRCLVVGFAGEAERIKEPRSHFDLIPQALAIDAAAWRFCEIQAGQAWVWPSTQEAFVPQMINLELTNGVSFTKGCYPGQEVVARSQYLGRLKRRTFLAELADFDPGLAPGMEIWSGIDPNQPVGQLVDISVNFASDGSISQGGAALIEVTLDAWESQDLRVASPQGQKLVGKTLPYSFPAAA